MKIVYLNGDDAGKSVELTSTGLTIGRETDNHMQLPVGGVSRYHARIEFVDGVFMLRDLGSTNGTKLNGVVLQQVQQLKANDVIVIGEQQLRVVDTAPEGGATDSKIGTSTVKIPAGIPVPEPAVPQFVFRPDSEVQPPPPPPVTDSSETATVNIAPEIADAGSDFFAKRDSDGNLFKKDGEKKEGAKSSLRSNLIFALVIMIMICGGVLLFRALNGDPGKAKNGEKGKAGAAAQAGEVENNDFFFYYETQTVDAKTQKLIRKKVYCRQENGAYILDMYFDDLPVCVQEVVTLEETTIKRHRENPDIVNYAKINTVAVVDIGEEKDWTRLAIGVGSNVHDFTAIGASKDASFRRAEDVVKRLILQTKPGKLMMSPKELREEAEAAFRKAEVCYKNRDIDPVDNSNALLYYLDALEFYGALRQHVGRDRQNQKIASERVNELSAKLKKIYDDAISKAEIAYAKGDYHQTIKICKESKKYFSPLSDEYKTFSQMESECNAKNREQQKGKK